MQDSFVSHTSGATSFVGPDAVALYRAASIRSGIKLYLATGIRPNRAYTPTAMRAAVSQITGKGYPASRKGLAQAGADLTAWIEAMTAAIPVEGGH